MKKLQKILAVILAVVLVFIMTSLTVYAEPNGKGNGKGNTKIFETKVEKVKEEKINTMKFDTPPVIKDGKVLIPVRALQNHGATVNYNSLDKKLIITKGEITITIQVDTKTIYVNGILTEFNTPNKSLNGRTVIPMGFIFEKLGIKTETTVEEISTIPTETPTIPIEETTTDIILEENID